MPARGPAEVRVGTCGFQKARRRHYEELDVVEVQQTFYDPRPPGRYAAWRREAPEDFEFTVKVWMLVTHEYNRMLWRRLREPLPWDDNSLYGGFKLNQATLWALEVTLEAAKALNARILVFQTPASFKASEENARRVISFFEETGITREYTAVWEPRGDWWNNTGLLYKTAEEAGIIIDGDLLRGRRPRPGQDIIYTRLHGLGGGEVNYRYKYTDDDLHRLADTIYSLGTGKTYVLFNNVYAFEDAVRFKEILRRETRD